MKSFLVLVVVAAVSAAPQNLQDVQILRYDSSNDGLGTYNFGYELSDGSKREEHGELKNQGTENEAFSVRGQYSWVGSDGVVHTVSYLADENGFRPTIDKGPTRGVSDSLIASIIG